MADRHTVLFSVTNARKFAHVIVCIFLISIRLKAKSLQKLKELVDVNNWRNFQLFASYNCWVAKKLKELCPVNYQNSNTGNRGVTN